jgi:hypothetical protein
MGTPPRFSDATAMEFFRDYYERGLNYYQLSDKYKAPIATLQSYLERPRLVEKYQAEVARKKAKAEIKAAIAAIKAQDASPQMIEQIIEIASQKVSETPIQYQYAIQNAASDILNRAGVKAAAEESKEVRIILESGIDLGEPGDGDERSD